MVYHIVADHFQTSLAEFQRFTSWDQSGQLTLAVEFQNPIELDQSGQ